MEERNRVPVYRSWSEFRGTGSLESWIYAAGRNVAHDEWRRRGRLRETDPPSEGIPDRATGAEETLAGKQERGRAVDALAALPSRMRACLLFRVREELSYREIAGRLGISEATVKVQIWMARKRLKGALNKS